MGSLVWLFAEHRELFAENQRLIRIVEDLERQLLAAQAGDARATSLIKQYQEEVLTEVPFDGGKIPSNVWLSPGEDERIRE